MLLSDWIMQSFACRPQRQYFIPDMTTKPAHFKKCEHYLKSLCVDIADRSVGSEGNRASTRFFESELRASGWATQMPEFDAIDWHNGGASLTVETDKKSRKSSYNGSEKATNGVGFDVRVSPYSKGYAGVSELAEVSTVDALEKGSFRDMIVLLHGEIAAEQLMPKSFVFYNPEEHRRIVAALESSGAAALVCATGRNPELAGGMYPFPLIEDGDFDIPSVYMTEEGGLRLLPHAGKKVRLISRSERIPGKACNVIGRKGGSGSTIEARQKDTSDPARGTAPGYASGITPGSDPGNPAPEQDGANTGIDTTGRIVITAHIDAKKGTPGAIDNATGVTVLLLLADLLREYDGPMPLEIVAFNGEDYYAVPGQMDYLASNRNNFNRVALNINIDGVGYREGPSACSYFGLPEHIHQKAKELLESGVGIVEGEPWVEGDHSIFLQHGRPAIAVTSAWMLEHMHDQTITHTPADTIENVDCGKLVELSVALKDFVTAH